MYLPAVFSAPDFSLYFQSFESQKWQLVEVQSGSSNSGSATSSVPTASVQLVDGAYRIRAFNGSGLLTLPPDDVKKTAYVGSQKQGNTLQEVSPTCAKTPFHLTR